MSTEFLETYNNESFQLAEVNAKIRAIEQDMIFVKDTEKDEKSKLEKLHIYNQRLLSYERKKETLEMKKCIDTLKVLKLGVLERKSRCCFIVCNAWCNVDAYVNGKFLDAYSETGSKIPSIDLSKCIVKLIQPQLADGKPFPFEIRFNGKSRIFSASSEATRLSCVKVLQAVSLFPENKTINNSSVYNTVNENYVLFDNKTDFQRSFDSSENIFQNQQQQQQQIKNNNKQSTTRRHSLHSDYNLQNMHIVINNNNNNNAITTNPLSSRQKTSTQNYSTPTDYNDNYNNNDSNTSANSLNIKNNKKNFLTSDSEQSFRSETFRNDKKKFYTSS